MNTCKNNKKNYFKYEAKILAESTLTIAKLEAM